MADFLVGKDIAERRSHAEARRRRENNREMHHQSHRGNGKSTKNLLLFSLLLCVFV
jgi:hypothetical protein